MRDEERDRLDVQQRKNTRNLGVNPCSNAPETPFLGVNQPSNAPKTPFLGVNRPSNGLGRGFSDIIMKKKGVKKSEAAGPFTGAHRL